jgi:hypothetical protein
MFENAYFLGRLAGETAAIEEAERYLDDLASVIRSGTDDEGGKKIANFTSALGIGKDALRTWRVEREASLGMDETLRRYPMRRARKGE